MSRRLEVELRYADWLISLALSWVGEQYHCLIREMHRTPFVALIDLDENRMEDGKELRFRFAEDSASYTYQDIYDCMGDTRCSILELIVALIIRCEESIMWDPEAGSQASVWFRDMLECLGLLDMTDTNFNLLYVEYVLDRFIGRNYFPDGKGGLFWLPKRNVDLRNVEIWSQMMWYLDDTILGRREI